MPLATPTVDRRRAGFPEQVRRPRVAPQSVSPWAFNTLTSLLPLTVFVVPHAAPPLTAACLVVFAAVSALNHAFPTALGALGTQVVKLSFVPVAMLGASAPLLAFASALAGLGVAFGAKAEAAGAALRQGWQLYRVVDALRRGALAPGYALAMLGLKGVYALERDARIKAGRREQFGAWHVAEHVDVAIYVAVLLAPAEAHAAVALRIACGLLWSLAVSCCTLSLDNMVAPSGAGLVIVLSLLPLGYEHEWLVLGVATCYALSLPFRVRRSARALVEGAIVCAINGRSGAALFVLCELIERCPFTFHLVTHPLLYFLPYILVGAPPSPSRPAGPPAGALVGRGVGAALTKFAALRLSPLVASAADRLACAHVLVLLTFYCLPVFPPETRHDMDILLLAIYITLPLSSWLSASLVFLACHLALAVGFYIHATAMWPPSEQTLAAIPRELRELFTAKLRANTDASLWPSKLGGYLVKPHSPLLTNENISLKVRHS